VLVDRAEVIGCKADDQVCLRRAVRSDGPRDQLGCVIGQREEGLCGRTHDPHPGRHHQRRLHILGGLAEAADPGTDLLDAARARQRALRRGGAYVQIRPPFGATRYPHIADGQFGARRRVLKRLLNAPTPMPFADCVRLGVLAGTTEGQLAALRPIRSRNAEQHLDRWTQVVRHSLTAVRPVAPGLLGLAGAFPLGRETPV